MVKLGTVQGSDGDAGVFQQGHFAKLRILFNGGQRYRLFKGLTAAKSTALQSPSVAVGSG